MEEKPKIRLVPPLTQKLLAENEEFQKQIREDLGVSSSPDISSVQRARNLLIAEEIKAVMKSLYASRRKALKKNDDEKAIELERQIAVQSERLASFLFEAGEFVLASKASHSRRRRAHYRAFYRAMELDDDTHCEHKKYKSVDGKSVPNYFRERDIYSEKHKRFVSVIKCNECEFRNIRPLPEDLAEASRRRAEFRAAEKGK